MSDPHSRPSPSQAVSKRVLGASNDRYAKNIHKRGLVDIRAKDKSKSFSVGPVMLGFFIFVVIGSSLLQIIRTATSGAGPGGWPLVIARRREERNPRRRDGDPARRRERMCVAVPYPKPTLASSDFHRATSPGSRRSSLSPYQYESLGDLALVVHLRKNRDDARSKRRFPSAPEPPSAASIDLCTSARRSSLRLGQFHPHVHPRAAHTHATRPNVHAPIADAAERNAKSTAAPTAKSHAAVAESADDFSTTRRRVRTPPPKTPRPNSR